MTGLEVSLRALHRPAPGRPGLVLVIAGLVVAGVALLPPAYLLVRALEDPARSLDAVLTGSTVALGLRTFALVGTVTLGALAIALPMAWLIERSDLPGRRLLAVLATLPLAVPSYVGALVFISAFGPRGLFQQALEPVGVERLPSIYGFTGATLVLALFTYPYLLLTLRPALAGLDPRLEELSRTFGYGRWTTFRRVVLPQLRPAAVSGGLLVALYTLSDFGGPALMRFDSFTRVIFIRYESTFDRSSAAALALVLGALALLVVALEIASRGRRRYDAVRGGGRAPTPMPLGRWRWAAWAFVAAVLGLALVLPLGVLGYWLARGIDAGVAFRGIASPLRGSVSAAGLAAVVGAVAALPVAILAVRHRGLFLSRAVEALSYTGYALPGLVVALALVFAGIRLGWLYQSLALLVLAYVLLFLPQAVNATRIGLMQVRPSMEEAARGLGRRPWQVLTSITLPLAARGVLAGGALVFLTTMKELPATLILAPTGFHTLATRVWSASSDARFAEAALPALVLIGVSALAVTALQYGTRDA